MNSLSPLIFALLQLALWPIIFYLILSWCMSRLFPSAKWPKRALRLALRLIFVEPVKKSYQAGRWLIVSSVTTRPEYHLNRTYIENFPTTPLAFLGTIEELLSQRQIIGIETSRIARMEWHLLSTRRIYLLVRFRDAVCLLCGVPIGTDFLVSWRYTAEPRKVLLIVFQIPFFGAVAEKLLRPATFYRADIYHALEQTIRTVVAEATAQLTHPTPRPLTEVEPRPLLRNFYGN